MTTAILIGNKISYYVGVVMLYISGYWWLYGWYTKDDIGYVVGLSNSKG